jgi:hypothetical protein
MRLDYGSESYLDWMILAIVNSKKNLDIQRFGGGGGNVYSQAFCFSCWYYGSHSYYNQSRSELEWNDIASIRYCSLLGLPILGIPPEAFHLDRSVEHVVRTIGGKDLVMVTAAVLQYRTNGVDGGRTFPVGTDSG